VARTQTIWSARLNTVRLALVDDHRVVTRSLKAYLESFADLKVVGIAATGEELLQHLHEWKPQIVLQDLLLPGGIDGIETTRRIREQAPGVHVIALTASVDEARMMGVLRAGAVGYIRKDADPEILLAAVRAVANGKTYIDPSVARQILKAAAPQDNLTPREIEVLRQLALGRSNKEIADALTISDETVKTHVGNVLSKLQVENRAQAIVQALKRGLVSLEELG
jgi:NarL family two-component system response regulator LiaR